MGAGGTRALTDTLDAEGEISYGTSGIGARALLSYSPAAADRYYIGYALDPDSRIGEELISGDGSEELGGIVAGVRHGFSERLSVYAEDKFNVFGTDPSLTQVYGVTYTPAPEWKLGGAVESGMIWGDTADLGYDDSKVRRTAFSATAAYSPDEKFTASLKGELRFDREGDAGDITSYYVAGRLSQALNPDWRFLATADVVLTDATESTRGGDYVETSLGYAYRPVENDRFNALAKYVFLYDLPGTDQVSADGTHDGPSQRSHIFSVDADYDLTQMLTIGAKYGLRLGEWKPREGGPWESSAAQLGVLRADFHVVRNWDVLVEARCLWDDASETANLGALAAVYRQLGDNFELGAGYNFGRFSDDLRDLTANDHGFFINAVGKL